MPHKLALIGFGTVGQGLCEILHDRAGALQRDFGLQAKVVAVTDKLKGAVYHPEGLNLPTLLDLARSGRSLDEYPRAAATGWDALQTIAECNADTICELAYTDVQTGQPAIAHCRAAFETGKHVVTSNKGPAALRYRELTEMAARHGVRFMIEGTVLSGTPVLNLARHGLAGNEITAIAGILNGTTNYILSQMEEGSSYEEALKEAQALGYAEADPTADVDGLDALAKVTILANVVLGQDLQPFDIPCEGITHITREDVETAREAGQRYKLLGEVRRANGKVSARVAPTKVDLEHPLASVMGAVNAVTFTTSLLGDVTVTGPGAGRKETGYSILVDIIDLHRTTR